MRTSHSSRCSLSYIPLRGSVVIGRAAGLAAVCFGLVASGCSQNSTPQPVVSAPPAKQAAAIPQRPAAVVVPEAQAPPLASASNEEPVPPPVVPTIPEPAVPPPSTEEPDSSKPRKILGRTTSDVRDAEKEKAKGAKKVQPKITGTDPISISGNAYVSIIGRTEILKIEHSVKLFHATNGRYPKDFAEFKKEIIDMNGIRLAQLPFYQEYGYDAANHQLVILEYPDRKAKAGIRD